MKTGELFVFLIAWVRLILVTEGGETELQVIESHQDTPAPKEPYIVIEYAPVRNKIGSASKSAPNETSGESLVISDNEFLIEMREVGGTGDRLYDVINSIERQDIKDLFEQNQIAFMGENGVQQLPSLIGDDKWVRQSLIELRLNVATESKEQSGIIEDISYTGTIKGGATGDEAVTGTA